MPTITQHLIPRINRALKTHLHQLHTGQITEKQFTTNYNHTLNQHYNRLKNKGIDPYKAAICLHAATCILAAPGLKEIANETNQPYEHIELRTIKEAAQDIAKRHNQPIARTTKHLINLITKHTLNH
jgi:uncharacterized Fe-S cluster protein YjdI